MIAGTTDTSYGGQAYPLDVSGSARTSGNIDVGENLSVTGYANITGDIITSANMNCGALYTDNIYPSNPSNPISFNSTPLHDVASILVDNIINTTGGPIQVGGVTVVDGSRSLYGESLNVTTDVSSNNVYAVTSLNAPQINGTGGGIAPLILNVADSEECVSVSANGNAVQTFPHLNAGAPFCGLAQADDSAILWNGGGGLVVGPVTGTAVGMRMGNDGGVVFTEGVTVSGPLTGSAGLVTTTGNFSGSVVMDGGFDASGGNIYSNALNSGFRITNPTSPGFTYCFQVTPRYSGGAFNGVTPADSTGIIYGGNPGVNSYGTQSMVIAPWRGGAGGMVLDPYGNVAVTGAGSFTSGLTVGGPLIGSAGLTSTTGYFSSGITVAGPLTASAGVTAPSAFFAHGITIAGAAGENSGGILIQSGAPSHAVNMSNVISGITYQIELSPYVNSGNYTSLAQAGDAVICSNTLSGFTSQGLVLAVNNESPASTSAGIRIAPSGNVGIGTGTPAAKLDVTGTGNFTGSVSIANSGAINSLNIQPISNTGGWGFDSILVGKGITVGTDGTLYIAYDGVHNFGTGIGFNQDKLRFLTYPLVSGTGTTSISLAAATKMTIASNGDVGIGTASPAATLDVSGTGHFSGAVNINGGLNINGGMGVTGAVTINNNMSVSGTGNFNYISAMTCLIGQTLLSKSGNSMANTPITFSPNELPPLAGSFLFVFGDQFSGWFVALGNYQKDTIFDGITIVGQGQQWAGSSGAGCNTLTPSIAGDYMVIFYGVI